MNPSGNTKPKLPNSVELLLPEDVVNHIYSYVPYPKKIKTPEVSPQLQKELIKIQSIHLNGKSAMYLKDLEDFCLD